MKIILITTQFSFSLSHGPHTKTYITITMDMQEEMYVTKAKYTLPILLANIGGQMGLFCGFSALTGFEVFELFADLFTALGRRLMAKVWWRAHVFPAGGANVEMA